MAGHPRVVTEDVIFHWDGVSQRLPRGQVMDVTPGSALERAIGRNRLRPVGAVTQAAEEPEPKEEAEPAAPAKPKAAAKKDSDDDKEGSS